MAKNKDTPPPSTAASIVSQVRSLVFGPATSEAGRKYKIVDDGKDYDFAAHRTSPRRINIIETVMNLVKGCLGGGIMGIHEAYMKAGLWAAPIMCLFLAFYIYHCGYLLTYAAQTLYKRLHLPFLSYPDLAEACFEVGPKSVRKYSRCFRYMIDGIIMIELFGACTVYLLIMAKTIKQLALGADDEEDDNILRLYVGFLYIPVILLGMVTSLKHIARFSMVGNVLVFLCVLTTVYYGSKAAPHISERPFFKNIMGFFEFCGVGAFSMQCIAIALSVENVMIKPTKFAFSLKIAYVFITIFVITTGFFGYWGFGEECRSPIHLNFPHELYPIVLKFLMAVMIYFTFAINFYAPFNLGWYYLEKRYTKRKGLWQRLYRFIIITILFCVAIAFPNVSNLMGLLGAFCISLVVFVFPPIIHLTVIWENPGLGFMKYILLKNVFIMLGGSFLLVVGCYTNGRGLINSMRYIEIA